MKEFFGELFAYNHHCNQKLVEVFTGNPDKISGKAVKLFNHILNAYQIWNNRIDPQHPIHSSWELHNTQELKSIDQLNYEQSLHILNKLDLNGIINYKTMKGQPLSNSIRDILFHIINHSTYHRTQIATEFRQNGLEPLVSDFVYYKI